MPTTRLTATGGPVAHGDHKDSNGSAAPHGKRMTTTTAATAAGGINIVLHKTSRIIATTAHPIATNPAVAAELGMAVAAAVAAAAEAAGTATEKMEEEDIQRQRRIYANDGGFCFKARSISIEYV